MVADQLTQSALSGATVNDNPVAVAFVRESHMRQDAEGFARTCEALAQAERADHRLIDCPTLIVTGDEDAVGPASIAHELADKIGGVKTVVLHRCGHWTPIEKSRECGTLLSDFLRANSGLGQAGAAKMRRGNEQEEPMTDEQNGFNGTGPIHLHQRPHPRWTGEYPYTGEVHVQGNRIKQVTKVLRGSGGASSSPMTAADGDRRHGRDIDARPDATRTCTCPGTTRRASTRSR